MCGYVDEWMEGKGKQEEGEDSGGEVRVWKGDVSGRDWELERLVSI